MDRAVRLLRHTAGKHPSSMLFTCSLVRSFCVGILVRIIVATVDNESATGMLVGGTTTALLWVCARFAPNAREGTLWTYDSEAPPRVSGRKIDPHGDAVRASGLDEETVTVAADALTTLASARPGQVAIATLEQQSRIVYTLVNGWERPPLSRCGAYLIAATMRTSFGRSCFEVGTYCHPSGENFDLDNTLSTRLPISAKAFQLLSSFAIGGINGETNGLSMPLHHWSATLHATVVGLWGLASVLVRPQGTIWNMEAAVDDCWSVALHLAKTITEAATVKTPIQAVPAAIMLLDRLSLLPELAFRKNGEFLIKVLALLGPDISSDQSDDDGSSSSAAAAAAAAHAAALLDVRRGAALVLARLGSSILGAGPAATSTLQTRRRWKMY